MKQDEFHQLEIDSYRYKQIEPVVRQMGGWANFRHWILNHAKNYFETCEKLEARHAKLLEAMREVQGVICSEYCGTLHHPECDKVRAAIEADQRSLADAKASLE